MRLNFSQNVKSALRALMANKLRSALTMLGIVIGVGSVVALVSVGTGAQSSITSQISNIGANVITVYSGSRNNFTPSGAGGGATAPLTYEEAQELKGLTGVAAVSPQVQSRQTLKYQSSQTSVQVVGVEPDYATVHPDQLDHGRFISTSDVSSKSRVAVVGSQVVDDLFGGLDPVGKSIKINGILFQVVGVMKEQGSGGFGMSRDTTTYVPITTAMARLSNTRIGSQKSVSTIEVSAANSDSIDAAMNAIKTKLRTLHKIGIGEKRRFHRAVAGRHSLGDDERGQHVDGFPRRDRRYLAGGRRHRRDEHHAGVRHRTHARDRPAQSSRRAAQRYSLSVLDRNAGDVDSGRHHWHCHRRGHLGAGECLGCDDHRRIGGIGRPGLRLLGGDRHFLRIVSSQSGGGAQAH